MTSVTRSPETYQEPRTSSISQSNLANRPRGVIGCADELHFRLGIKLHDQLLHNTVHMWPQQIEAAHREVTDQRIAGLSHRCLRVLQADSEELKETRLAIANQGFKAHTQALGETRKEI